MRTEYTHSCECFGKALFAKVAGLISDGDFIAEFTKLAARKQIDPLTIGLEAGAAGFYGGSIGRNRPKPPKRTTRQQSNTIVDNADAALSAGETNSHNQNTVGNGTVHNSTKSGLFRPAPMLGGFAAGAAGMNYLMSPSTSYGYNYGYPYYSWR